MISEAKLSAFGCPLPPTAILRWSDAQDWDQPALADEEVFCRKAVLKRQREFRAGRNTARKCFQELAIAQSMPISPTLNWSIGVGQSREPIWPKLFTGSISHTQFQCDSAQTNQEHCAVVVAPLAHVVSIGIDIERVEHLSQDSLDLIVTPSEWRRSREYCWPTYWPKFLFAAKESFYKCLFPMTGAYIDFLEADFHLSAVAQYPGLYQVDVIAIQSTEFKLPIEQLLGLKGYVCCDDALIKAAFWIEQS